MMDERIANRSDPEILTEVGRRLARVRRSAGLTQADAAERAGLDRTTVSRAERGENPNLLTLVRLLRVYRRLAALDSFIPEPDVSPMELIRSRKGRKRDEDRGGA